MRESPCLDCRVLTRFDVLVDASDGAKPELVCPECVDVRDAERADYERELDLEERDQRERACACGLFCSVCIPDAG